MFLPQHLSVSTPKGFAESDLDSSMEEQAAQHIKKTRKQSPDTPGAATGKAISSPKSKKAVRRVKSGTEGLKKKSKAANGESKSLRTSRTVSDEADLSASDAIKAIKSSKAKRRKSLNSLSLSDSSMGDESESEQSASDAIKAIREQKKASRRKSVSRAASLSSSASSITGEAEPNKSNTKSTHSPLRRVQTADGTTRRIKKSSSKGKKSSSSTSLESKLEKNFTTKAATEADASSVGSSSVGSARSRRSRRDDVVVTELPPGAKKKISRSNTQPLPGRKSSSKSPPRRAKSDVTDNSIDDKERATDDKPPAMPSVSVTGTATPASTSPLAKVRKERSQHRRGSLLASVPGGSTSPLKGESQKLRSSTGSMLPKRQKTWSPNKSPKIGDDSSSSNTGGKAPLGRNKTFDESRSARSLPSNPPRSIPGNPPRSRRTSLPSADARAMVARQQMMKKSSNHSKTSKGSRSLKTVRISSEPPMRADYDLPDKYDLNKFWYSQGDLKMLMDHEIQCIVRSSGTARGLHFCKRGIEPLLEGKDKASKIQAYVRNIMTRQAEIKQNCLSKQAMAKELRTHSQTLTKDDRKQAYRLGFQDASEVQVFTQQNQASDEQSIRSSTNKKASTTMRPKALAVGESVRLLVDTHAPHLGESIRDIKLGGKLGDKLGDRLGGIKDFADSGLVGVKSIAHDLGDSVRGLAHAPKKLIAHNIKPILGKGGSNQQQQQQKQQAEERAT